MITKKKWTELVTSNNLDDIIDTQIVSLASQIDTLMNEKFDINTSFATYVNYIKTAFFSTEGNNQWSGLYIYMSSFAEGDQRYKFLIKDKLLKYLAFYIKFTTDDGLAKTISTDRGYTDTPRVSTTENNIHSELPQIQLNNFEEGIKYASSMDKNVNSFDGQNTGTAYERKSEVTWDEAMNNLRTVLFNDLVDYVTRIPNMLFNHYSLDTMPFIEQMKATFKYFQNLSEVYKL